MTESINYPLCFAPILMERIWGGRRLETLFGKELPPDRPFGESWEINDCGDRASVVANGPLRGRTLREILAESPRSFFGTRQVTRDASSEHVREQFPLLVKWIDARERLSVQVHPRDGHPRLKPGERGKSECWLIVAAEPQSEMYVGLRRGIDRAALVHELARGTVDRCLNTHPARPGDFYFVPAGTVHAIGDGVLIAEIQQSSDVTYRLFDWNRVDRATGRPRELQIDAALDSIDFQQPAPCPVSVAHEAESAASPGAPGLPAESAAPFAIAWRRVLADESLGESGRFHVLMCLNGFGEISGGGETVSLRAGSSVLLPATGPFRCRPRGPLELLDAWIP